MIKVQKFITSFIICLTLSIHSMGCTSSQIQPHQSYLTRKPQVWFILGGPGSNKGKIIQYLVRDYKFTYLSLFEILQFEKQRSTSDAELIKKSIIDKKDFSTELITRLLKKAIASLGPMRYLIDSYPRHQADIQFFEKQPFIRQIVIQKLIHIQVSAQKMKQTGMQAKKSDKRSQEQVEKQVQTVIDEYQKHEQQITEYYKGRNSLLSIPQRATEDQTYNQLRLQLQNLSRFRHVQQGDCRVFFAAFNLQLLQSKYTFQHLMNSYGLHHLSYQQLMQQCRKKSNPDSKYLDQCQKKKQLPSAEFVIYLFRKQIEKKDYMGNFVVTGFPRNINDAVLWDKTFGWEVVVEAYMNFWVSDQKLKAHLQQSIDKSTTEKGQLPLEKHLRDKKVLTDFYQKQSKLTKINTEDHQEIVKQIENVMIKKAIPKRTPISKHKIVFISTINTQLDKIDLTRFKQINLADCYESQAKQNNLHSDLIQNYLQAGTPLPGRLAVKILLNNLQSLLSQSQSQAIIVGSFPNSLQQLTTWTQQVGSTHPIHSVIYFQTSQDQIKQNLAKHKLQPIKETVDRIMANSLQLQQYLKNHSHIARKITSEQKLQEFISKIA